MSKRILRAAVASLCLGAVMFVLQLWVADHSENAIWIDLTDLLAIALLLLGTVLIVWQLRGSKTVTGLFLTAVVLLLLARALDFTEDFPALDDITFIGQNGLGHGRLIDISQQFGSLFLLLTAAALLYDTAKLRNTAIEESKRYANLHQSSLYLARIADTAAEAVFGSDRSGCIRSWNLGAAQIFGYSKDEALKLSVDQLFTPPLFGGSEHLVDRVSREQSLHDVEAVAQGKNGKTFLAGITLSVVRDNEGQPIGVSIVVRDIEERRRSEQALIASKLILAGALQNAEIGMFILDDKAEVLEFNSRMEDLTGYKKPLLPSLEEGALLLLDSSVDFVGAIRKKVLQGGASIEFRNLRIQRPDGKHRTCNVAVSPVMDSGGAVIAAAGIAVDITDREALQATLLQAQKMESIGRLAGGIAHDFNNILGGILGYASLLRQHLSPGSSEHHYAESIEDSAKRASELTHQLLAFARGGTYRLQPVDLNEVARETIKLVARSLDPNIKVSLHPSKEIASIEADPTQMQQILMNLCINARDAIDRSGEIGVRIENVSVDEAARQRLNLQATGRYVCMTVLDNGCGMPPEVARRIFEPFYSTKEIGEGYGLGLSVVYGIVEAHKGTLHVESEVGVGTQVHAYFPATHRPTPRSAPSPLLAARSASGTETILIVDDEELIRILLRDILVSEGYRVIEAMNGEEGLALYKQHRDSIKLAILDVLMPGMNGMEVLAKLQSINPELRCIVSSGYGADALDHAALNHRYVRFVAKPYQAPTLALHVRELLDL